MAFIGENIKMQYIDQYHMNNHNYLNKGISLSHIIHTPNIYMIHTDKDFLLLLLPFFS